MALSKAGEISIVRANHDKAIKEYERRLAVTQRAHADEIARQRVELEMSNKDKEKIETSNRFLEHELKQKEERTRHVQKSQKHESGYSSKAMTTASPVGTPRKQRTLAVGDGFDDGEIVMLSPSKLRPRSKPSTPKAASKRKRAVTEDSPAQPLELNQPVEPTKPAAAEAPDSGIDPALLSQLGTDEEKFQVQISINILRLVGC